VPCGRADAQQAVIPVVEKKRRVGRESAGQHDLGHLALVAHAIGEAPQRMRFVDRIVRRGNERAQANAHAGYAWRHGFERRVDRSAIQWQQKLVGIERKDEIGIERRMRLAREPGQALALQKCGLVVEHQRHRQPFGVQRLQDLAGAVFGRMDDDEKVIEQSAAMAHERFDDVRVVADHRDSDQFERARH
jgi:hypothetical protein